MSNANSKYLFISGNALVRQNPDGSTTAVPSTDEKDVAGILKAADSVLNRLPRLAVVDGRYVPDCDGDQAKAAFLCVLAGTLRDLLLAIRRVYSCSSEPDFPVTQIRALGVERDAFVYAIHEAAGQMLKDVGALPVVEVDRLRKHVEGLRETLSTDIPDELVYIGGGRLKIGDTPYTLTSDAHIKFMDTIVSSGGHATTAELRAVVNNPSDTVAELLEWKDGILKPFIIRPAKKGDGYRVKIYIGK